jgi:hypothetical protein
MDDALETIAKWLADLDKAQYVAYQIKDDRGHGLDCLKVVQTGPASYLGIHHSLQKGAFDLNLVESADLKTWKHVRVLDHHGHQGTLRPCGQGWLAAWEKDGPNTGNWIRVAYFPTLVALRAGKAERTINLPPSLSKAAEGTPHFRKVPPDPLTGTIELGFHCYRNADVDRQAIGTLKNFKDWKASELKETNQALEPTYRGNIGDRDQFQLDLVHYTLLEAQLTKNDWASWRILLRSVKGPFRQVAFRTPGKSTSFANPSTTRLRLPTGEDVLVLSMFLPSQGNAPKEAGQMIAIYPVPRGVAGLEPAWRRR